MWGGWQGWLPTSHSVSLIFGSEKLRLAHLDGVTIRIVEPEHALSPCLPLDGMDQFDMRRDARERGVDILVFKVEKQVPSAVTRGLDRGLASYRLFKRSAFMYGEPAFEEDEVSSVLDHHQSHHLLVKGLRPVDATYKRDRVDKTHGSAGLGTCLKYPGE